MQRTCLFIDTAPHSRLLGLAPGAYIFRLVSPTLMQVTNADRSQTLATFFVLGAERSIATDNYAVKLVRVGPAAPLRIAELFLPGARGGYELLYPAMLKPGANRSN
jgi:hypothetical protein